MREFRRISFTDAEVMNALVAYASEFAGPATGTDRKIIRSRRVDNKFVFELANVEPTERLVSSLTVPTETAFSAIVDYSIQSKIPIPKQANKNVRIIDGCLCLDIFVDDIGNLEYHPSSREFRRIIFSNAELQTALEQGAPKLKRQLSKHKIVGVGQSGAPEKQEILIELFNLRSFDHKNVCIPLVQAQTSLLEYAHREGVLLPQMAKKTVNENDGLINIEMRL